MSGGVGLWLGAPRSEQETLNVSANSKARTLILFLRISSSALAAKSVGKAGRNPKWCVCRLQRRAILLHPLWMRQTRQALPLSSVREACAERNAVVQET